MTTEQGVALITGGGRGLGRAFALALAQHGFAVVVTARTEAEIADTADAIVRAGGRAMALSGDVTDRDAVKHIVTTTETELGPIDLLINNAGVLSAGRVGTLDPDEWWQEMAINVRGPFLLANTIVPRMLARKRGRIINVASYAGLEPIETGASYVVSKSALICLSEIIALETTRHGLATFTIHPGTVRTPMNERFMESEEMRRRSPDVAAWFDQLFAEGKDTPIERPVQLVVDLASGRYDALSGCFLGVDDDLEALLAQADEIQRDGRLRLKLAP